MTGKEYDTVINNLNALVWEATDIINNFKTCSHFKTLPENKRASLINRAGFVRSKQTKILQSEWYHILGMGDLSIGQELMFNRLLRAFINTRPYIEYIAACDLRDENNHIMKINKEYNCTSLGVVVKKTVVGQNA